MNERIPQHYVESVNKLTARVTKEMEQKEYKSILITSSVSQEGKSTLAANFAISAAKSGKKVVLVDCDMRNPSIASVMNEKGSFPGIGAVLFGKTDLEKALKKIDIPGGSLKVLYGGKTEDQAGELLGTKNMQSLIAVLAESADLVVFDAAPSDILVDSSVLAKFVDAAMYVVRYDYVKMRQIKNGLQTLNMSGVDILGYIFNSDERGHNRGYGYGYRYGYGYYGGYGRYLESGREERRIERFRRTKKD